ncbi:hypothetical protein D3C85_1462950 [compost metagenome]
MPALLGEKPSPSCRKSGVRKGMAPLPRRANRLPQMPMAKVVVLNSARLKSGCATVAA